LPHRSTLTNDEFLDSTLDVWRIPAESARRVGHPAPFPVELPLRLIELYTYEGDLVLDPFLGSGSTAVAAVRAGRRYAGYDTDPAYVGMARARVEEEHARIAAAAENGAAAAEAWGRAHGEGRGAPALAELLVEETGFTVTTRMRALAGLGTAVSLVAEASDGREWWFDVTGGFTTVRGGLVRADVLWRTLGRASVLRSAGAGAPLVLLTSHLPSPGTPGDCALRALGPTTVFDVVAMGSPAGRERLAAYGAGGQHHPLPGFWTARDLGLA
jgi:site-specific DNA-methyltransferase (adenine-specific)